MALGCNAGGCEIRDRLQPTKTNQQRYSAILHAAHNKQHKQHPPQLTSTVAGNISAATVALYSFMSLRILKFPQLMTVAPRGATCCKRAHLRACFISFTHCRTACV